MLTFHVTAINPAFVAGLAPYLRTTLLMRSAAVVIAAEYVAAGGPHGRSVVDGVLQRADEPAELLGYWLTTHGRNVPMAVKRGVADAARRLYNERTALRYDGLSRQFRMADVIELTHPQPRDDRQSAQFAGCSTVATTTTRWPPPTACRCSPPRPHSTPSRQTTVDRLRDRGPAALAEAGFSWERLPGWLPGGMDAEAWASVSPVDGRDGLGPQPAQLRRGRYRRGGRRRRHR